MANPIHNGVPLIKPGMLAKVTLPVGSSQRRILVPQDALVLNRDHASVFVVESGADAHIVREIPVEVGTVRDQMVQVRSCGR